MPRAPNEDKSAEYSGTLALLGVTVLMGAASWYGGSWAQAAATDPLERIFVGVPNQLTLPPDFPVKNEILIGGTTQCGTSTDVAQAGEKRAAARSGRLNGGSDPKIGAAHPPLSSCIESDSIAARDGQEEQEGAPPVRQRP